MESLPRFFDKSYNYPFTMVGSRYTVQEHERYEEMINDKDLRSTSTRPGPHPSQNQLNS